MEYAMSNDNPYREVGRGLIESYHDVIVEALDESTLDWTIDSPYLDFASRVLAYLREFDSLDLTEEAIQENRADILQGMEQELRDSEAFEVEVKEDSTGDSNGMYQHQRLTTT